MAHMHCLFLGMQTGDATGRDLWSYDLVGTLARDDRLFTNEEIDSGVLSRTRRCSEKPDGCSKL